MRHLLVAGKRSRFEEAVQHIETIVNIYVENDNLQGALFLRKSIRRAKMQKETLQKQSPDLINATQH